MSPPVKPFPPVALVTGGARRVGAVIAETLREHGWRVLVHARTHEDARAAAADPSDGFGAELSNPDEVAALATWAVERSNGRLDLLVNNASSFTSGLPQDTDPAVFSAAMNVNALAPLLLASGCLPALRAAHGVVINLGDRGPREVWEERTAHAASKAALATISACCAQAWAPEVSVHLLELGLILPPDNAPASVHELRDSDGNGWAGAESVARDVLRLATATATDGRS